MDAKWEHFLLWLMKQDHLWSTRQLKVCLPICRYGNTVEPRLSGLMLGLHEIVWIIENMNINEEHNPAKLIKLRKQHLIVKQHFYKSFGIKYRKHLHCPLWIPVHVYRALSSSSSFATFSNFHFSPLLVSKMLANLMIFSLFLRISEVCCLLTPYSADKLHGSLFSFL